MSKDDIPLANVVSNGNFSSYATGWNTHQPRYYVAYINEDGTFSSAMTDKKPFCVIDALSTYESGGVVADEIRAMIDALIAERYRLSKQERSEE